MATFNKHKFIAASPTLIPDMAQAIHRPGADSNMAARQAIITDRAAVRQITARIMDRDMGPQDR